MAPELVNEEPYNNSIDIWSLGVILYELYVGKPPFFTNNLISLIEKIKNNSVEYPTSMSDQFTDFLKGLLEKNPMKRLNWPELLDHPFVQETEEEKEDSRRKTQKYEQWIALNFYNTVGNLPSVLQNDQFRNKNLEQQTGSSALAQSDPLDFEDFDHQPFKEPTSPTWKKWLEEIQTNRTANKLRTDPKLLENFLSIFKLNHFDLLGSEKKKTNFLAAIQVLCLVVNKSDSDQQSQIDILQNKGIPKQLLSKIKILSKDKDPSPDIRELLNHLMMGVALSSKALFNSSKGIDPLFYKGLFPSLCSLFELGVKFWSEDQNLATNTVKMVGQLITQACQNLSVNSDFYRELVNSGLLDKMIALMLSNESSSSSERFNLHLHILNLFGIIVHPLKGQINPFPWLKEGQRSAINDKDDVLENSQFANQIIDYCYKKITSLQQGGKWVAIMARYFEKGTKEGVTQITVLRVRYKAY